MNIPKVIDFDSLEPIEVPVNYRGKRFVLVEPDAEAARQYRNAVTAGARVVDGKYCGTTNAGDVETLLISLCLFELYDDKGEVKRRPVILPQVRKLPSRLTKQLFDIAMEIGELKPEVTIASLRKQIKEAQEQLAALEAEEVQDSAKNVPSDTTESSASPAI